MKNKIVTLLSLVLALLMLVSLASCAKEKYDDVTVETLSPLWQTAMYHNDISFGTGDKTIKVEVKAEDKSVVFTLSTNYTTLADALFEHQLVEGEDGPYGLYIKRVNGILADYDEDATYWSLSKDGETLMSGASEVEIADGDRFELTRTK